MNFLRNTFGVLLGLFVAALIINLGIKTNTEWITYKEFFPFGKWDKFLSSVEGNRLFFLTLLLSSGISATLGGVVTAMVVKYAKVAYALFIGFILLFIALLDIILFPHHPTFYKIGIFLTYFPFSWLGGKLVELFTERSKKRKKKKEKKELNYE